MKLRSKGGRPPIPTGAGTDVARRMSLNLDADAEAALAVLRTMWGGARGPMPAATAAKRALIDLVRMLFPDAYADEARAVRERREQDAA